MFLIIVVPIRQKKGDVKLLCKSVIPWAFPILHRAKINSNTHLMSIFLRKDFFHPRITSEYLILIDTGGILLLSSQRFSNKGYYKMFLFPT